MKLTPCDINPKTMDKHRDVGDHAIEACFDLSNGWQLHRFLNAADVPYSAIYDKDGFELYSSERQGETRMLEAFKKYELH